MEGKILIRPMRRGDIKEIIEIEKASFQDPWREDAFYNELYNKDISIFLVMEVDGKVVGYGGMWVIKDEAHIVNLAIHPQYRRQGLGQKLMKVLFEKAEKRGVQRITLEVRASNIVAQNFYKKLGFQEIAIRKKYYRDTKEDAIVMWINNLYALKEKV
jgi:ribosomal-protein-alanine N-acetyltransferase